MKKGVEEKVMIIFGKQSFKSKKGVDCFMLHAGQKQPNVDGLAVSNFFVDQSIFNKVRINKNYDVTYGAYPNGRAFIQDMIECVGE